MRKHKQAVGLMTALVPTIGHGAMIRFMAELIGPMGFGYVIVSGRDFEPVPLEARVMALQEFADKIHNRITIVPHDDNDAPQNPATDAEWQYWKDVVTQDGFLSYDYFVASEPYGKTMAELISSEFVPFDIDRNMFEVKGTNVRDNIQYHCDLILPEFIPCIRKTVTIFGLESTGKTTLTNQLANRYCSMTHEFARPYLEQMDDKSVTDAKMATIVRGQYALQKTAEMTGALITIQDTDLLSTIGYYRIYGGDSDGTDIEYLFEETKSDLYIVTPDNIPFEADPLRYGGDKREGDMKFWIDLLEEYDCTYVVLESSDSEDRYYEAMECINYQAYTEWFKSIRDFVRD